MHSANTNNPHGVTKAQVGLGNVNNTADIDKPVSTDTQDFVNSSINAMAAHFVSKDALNSNFATKAELDSATTFYHAGTAYIPTMHDYVVVLSDETSGNAQTRYMNVSETTTPSWQLQYIINDAPFTSAQNNAINSGVTGIKVSSYDTHLSNTSNPHNITKTQVGLGNVNNTSDADKPVSSAMQLALDGKVDKVTGKGLSTNDYTTTEKDKLASIDLSEYATQDDLTDAISPLASETYVDTAIANKTLSMDLLFSGSSEGSVRISNLAEYSLLSVSVDFQAINYTPGGPGGPPSYVYGSIHSQATVVPVGVGACKYFASSPINNTNNYYLVDITASGTTITVGASKVEGSTNETSAKITGVYGVR